MQRESGAVANDFDIVVMNADGSSEVNLTERRNTRRGSGLAARGAPARHGGADGSYARPAHRAFQKGTSFAVSWSSTDGSPVGGFSGGSYYVRVRTATSSNAAHALTPYAWWLKATSASPRRSPASRVSPTASRDGERPVGNVSAWSNDRCTAIPLDGAPMLASTGWTHFGGDRLLQTPTAPHP